MAKKLRAQELRLLEEVAHGGFRLGAAFERSGIRTARPNFELQKLRKNPVFERAYQEKLTQKKSEEAITEEIVISELANIAFFDIIDYYDDQGRLRKFKDIPPQARRAIVGVKTQKLKDADGAEYLVVDSYEIADKLGALHLLGKTKLVDMFTKKEGDKTINATFTDLSTSELAARILAAFETGGGQSNAPCIEGQVEKGETQLVLPDGRDLPA